MLVIYLLLVLYLSLNSKFILFTTYSVMLGLGFWKLYFPDIFASCFSAHPASRQRWRWRQGEAETRGFFPAEAWSCQHCPGLGICPTSGSWLRPGPQHVSVSHSLLLGPLEIDKISWALPGPPRSGPLWLEALPSSSLAVPAVFTSGASQQMLSLLLVSWPFGAWRVNFEIKPTLLKYLWNLGFPHRTHIQERDSFYT